jgi:hypothetical protein
MLRDAINGDGPSVQPGDYLDGATGRLFTLYLFPVGA